MEEDFSAYTDEELQKIVDSNGAWRPEAQPAVQETAPQGDAEDFSQYTDEELQRIVDSNGAWRPETDAVKASPAPQGMTSEERIASRNAAIARAQQPGDGETGFWGAAGDALAEAARGAGRAVKSGVKGLVVDTVTGLTRLAGTPLRALGYHGLHKLADRIDQSYANFGASALESEYGNPEGWAALGEKLTGVAGSLGGLAAGGAGIAKGVSMLGKAGKVAAEANQLRSLGKVAEAAVINKWDSIHK